MVDRASIHNTGRVSLEWRASTSNFHIFYQQIKLPEGCDFDISHYTAHDNSASKEGALCDSARSESQTCDHTSGHPQERHNHKSSDCRSAWDPLARGFVFLTQGALAVLYCRLDLSIRTGVRVWALPPSFIAIFSLPFALLSPPTFPNPQLTAVVVSRKRIRSFTASFGSCPA